MFRRFRALNLRKIWNRRAENQALRLLAAAAITLLSPAGCSRPGASPAEEPAALAGAEEAAAAEAEATGLAQEFANERDEAAQIEIVFRLGANGCAAAQNALAGIYRSATLPGMRVTVVEAIGMIDADDLTASLPVLLDAVDRGNPGELRNVAVDTMRQLNHPQTIPVWRALLDDPDPMFREAARAAIEYLSAGEAR